jgi:hypothetical protein
MTNRMQRKILWFAEHAGYCTPPGRMACAKTLALAEDYAADMDWEHYWEPDGDGCGGCDCGDKRCRCSSGKPHLTEYCVLKDKDGNVLASLGGICEASEDYRRVVQAELSAEAMRAEISTQEIMHI